MTLPLDGLRALSASFLPDAASILRPLVVSDGDGSSVTWQQVATDVPCRLSPAGSSGSEAVGTSARVEAQNNWTVWVAALTDVAVVDRLLIDTRTFEILRVGARSYEVIRECLCREIT